MKDADIPEDQFAPLYTGLLLTVRRMFHHCKLVHADLSEYNILHHNSQLYIIDVGQSVEHDHPSAFDFLRSDLKNVEEFFGRRGVQCVGLRRAFEFIIGDCINEGDEEPWLQTLLTEAAKKDTEGNKEGHSQGQEKQSDDKVFMQSYIPRTLNEVYDPERDVDFVNQGTGQSLIYSDVIGVVGASEGLKLVRIKEPGEFLNEDKQSSESTSDGSQSESQEENPESGFKGRQPRGHRNEDKEMKKVRFSLKFLTHSLLIQERKRAVKEAAREKRKQKIPKAEKKRRIKVTRS